MSDPKSAPSSFEIEEYERQVTTALQRVSQAAGLVLEEWQTRFLVDLVTTRELPAVLRYTQRRMHSSTAIEKIFEELLSTSPESPAPPATS